MAFTMHSHSGQFCPGHAKDQLEAVVQHAIRIGYKTLGLTEHMPRTGLEDLYPEELDDPQASLAVLMPRHDEYLLEAQRLQAKYASQIHILIGFEGEFIRAATYAPLVQQLASHPAIDYFIGSLHHTCGVPIDFDKAYYAKAREAAGGSEEQLYTHYYDEQYAMLTTLQPRVVGHFDLIRLLSEEPERDLRTAWDGRVWAKVVRNLEAARQGGGWLECNSSALRKGLAEPYPTRAIAEEWLKMGGSFTLSDDSHGIAQVATNYGRALDYLESLGVKEVRTLQKDAEPNAPASAKAVVKEVSVTIEDIRKSLA
ncbi:Polymerase/histidinol phosphatase-like protein [Coniella lustricola]|uniref:Histidinol-phosphatase n=1 Tax=Coniella lustricola TaxID=2025994 RepID=A0A2T3AKU2_9PEZI|nr:Polymerase/histidinol phosphatase-like protein [Coniella lustricola]